MKRILLWVFLFFAATVVFAGDQVWEGTTAMSRYGEFPTDGLYGASNSFPVNTLIRVENLENGKKADIIVVARLEDPSLFLLVSIQAAEALGISPTEVVRARVTLAGNGSTDSQSAMSDFPYSPDPDINPAAIVGDPNASDLLKTRRILESEALTAMMEEIIPVEPEEEVIIAEAEETPIKPDLPDLQDLVKPEKEGKPKEKEELPETTPPEEVVEEEIEEEIVEEPLPEEKVPEQAQEEPVISLLPAASEVEEKIPVVDALPVLPEDTDRPVIIELAHSEGLAETITQIDLSVPDLSESGIEQPGAESFPLASREESEAPAVVDVLPVQPGDIEPPEAVTLYSVSPEEQDTEISSFAEPKIPITTDEEPVELTREEEAPVTEVISPAGDVDISLQPAEERPPQPDAIAVTEETPSKPKVITVKTDPVRRGEVIVTERLETAGYYLQLGVYSEERTAREVAEGLGPAFPVTVFSEMDHYKVLLGPLNSDEGGALLLTLRDRGYRDAFIRSPQ